MYREILILTVVNHLQNPDHSVSVIDASPTDRHVEPSLSIRTFTAFALRTSGCAFIEGHRGRWRLGRPVNRRRERDANLDGLMTGPCTQATPSISEAIQTEDVVTAEDEG